MPTLNTYYLSRAVDHSGCSGIGKVATVFEFDDKAIIVWDGNNTVKVSSVAIYSSLEDLIKVHGHEGDSVLELTDFPQDFMSTLCEKLDASFTVFDTLLTAIADKAVSSGAYNPTPQKTVLITEA